jgi:5-formyltetrahydrofolate cyclo-ligase
MPKMSIRQPMLARRRAFPEAEATLASRLAQQALIASSEFVAARIVGLYAPVHNEVDTAELMRAALASAKMVLFPAVCPGGLEFRRVSDSCMLHRGAFNIPEPDVACPAHSPEEADLIVVPGVAFDLKGKRIGYGKGYYDRSLHKLEGRGRLVGLCYDFQVVNEIKAESHDVMMDLIITERRVIRPRY